VTHTFTAIANWCGRMMGSPAAFIGACVLVILWAVCGPVFGFSDTWQLVINTSTTIATFLMVFLVQNGQNRSAEALHIKLDELLRALPQADTKIALAHIETADENVLVTVREGIEQASQTGETK
jgi:low affinity Fe/Cu permease